jgi:hypothetical protein
MIGDCEFIFCSGTLGSFESWKLDLKNLTGSDFKEISMGSHLIKPQQFRGIFIKTKKYLFDHKSRQDK